MIRSGCRLSGALKRTALHDFHVAQTAKMVDFCGWSMPVEYTGLRPEHHACRENAAIFDVSHMGQLHWTGKDCEKFLESVTPVSLDVPAGTAKLSVLTNERGCVIDDTMISRPAVETPDCRIYMVINAGCTDKDLAHLDEQLDRFDGDAKYTYLTDRALVAIQGPKAMGYLQPHVEHDLKRMPFMTGMPMSISGIDAYVTRCGYTGEDGCEISVRAEDAVKLTELFLEAGAELAGLGARNSLRMEAGLCLYGNDLDEETSPVEAGLLFTIPKARRGSDAGWLGAHRTASDIAEGVTRKRVGLRMTGPSARGGESIVLGEETIGSVTSGGPAPSLNNKPIAMGYVRKDQSKAGTELHVVVRNKKYPAVVTKLPFVPANYYKVPA